MFFPHLGSQDVVARGPFEHEFTLPMSWAERRESTGAGSIGCCGWVSGAYAFNVETSLRCSRVSILSGLQSFQWIGTVSRPGVAATQKQTVAYSGAWTRYIYPSKLRRVAGRNMATLQVFVQCLHQRTSLEEIFWLSHDKLAALRAEYEAYNCACVSMQVTWANRMKTWNAASPLRKHPGTTHELDVTMDNGSDISTPTCH